MEQYNYREHMKDDIREYIEENYTREEIPKQFSDEYVFREKIYGDLWIADSVTGNASGSYFFSSWKAEEAICHNLELLEEVLDAYDDEEWRKHVWENKGNAELMDIWIRCYLLSDVLSEVIEEEGYFA